MEHTGQATFKLPFPLIEETRHSKRVRQWREQTPKFDDTLNTRQNWKRFKVFCRLLYVQGLVYQVSFSFSSTGMVVDIRYGGRGESVK